MFAVNEMRHFLNNLHSVFAFVQELGTNSGWFRWVEDNRGDSGDLDDFGQTGRRCNRRVSDQVNCGHDSATPVRSGRRFRRTGCPLDNGLELAWRRISCVTSIRRARFVVEKSQFKVP